MMMAQMSLGDKPHSHRFDFHMVRGRQATTKTLERFEGESNLTVNGKARPQGMRHYGVQWSNDSHLLWDGEIGESLETSFEVATTGIYDIELQLTAAGDYGIFDLSMPDTSIRKRIDLYNSSVDLAPRLTFSNVRLKAGKQVMSFLLVAANPRARKFQERGYLMGIDYLQLSRKDKPKEDKPKAEPNVSVQSSTKVPKKTSAETIDATQLTSLIKTYCRDCHEGAKSESKLNLSHLSSLNDWRKDIEMAQKVRDALQHREMPPANAKQPSDRERKNAILALDSIIQDLLQVHRPLTPVVMRRMNRYEYNNAVRDLLHLQGDIYPLPEKIIRAGVQYFDPASGRMPSSLLVGNRTLGKNQVERQILTGVSPFAIDLQAEGGFNNRGEELGISPIFIESLLRLGRTIVHSPEFDSYCHITDTFFSAPNDLQHDPQNELARARLANFLERAFRSPVDAATLDRYHKYFRLQLQRTNSFRESMKDVVAAVLASPRFIYLVEPSKGQTDSLLGSYELATRLSFFLWSSIPDKSLLAAARDGSLQDPEVLDSQVKRMLRDPKSHSLTQNFARQWLRLDQLVTAVPDFDRFPEYYARIGCEQWKFGLQMMVEPLLLFDSIVVEDRSIMLLIDCQYSFRSDELQSWYEDDVPFDQRPNRNRFNTNQQQFHKRKLTDRRQGGVITSAATLTMTSSPLRTNPISRGAWVATVILNRPPPPPPDEVPPIEADDHDIESTGMTLRERLVQHQVSPTCVACHAKIDPLGFALENYDAVGRWRGTYHSGRKIDASGKLFGTLKFNDVTELKDVLLSNPKLFMQAFSEHLLSYAIGRELKIADAPAVTEIVSRVAANHGQFTTVVREIVKSRPFRYQTKQEPPTDFE